MSDGSGEGGRRTERFLRHWPLWSFVAISAVVGWAYYPSLFHTIRGDQFQYVAEYSRFDDWPSLALGGLVYERTRGFNPGDASMFSPLQHFLRGNELWLFRYRFALWQAAGILLHLGVVACFFRVLLEIHRHPLAIAFTLLFSVLFATMEQVVWHHVHGYLLSYILALLALLQLLRHDREGRTRWCRLGWIAGLCMAAGLAHTAAVPYAIVFALYLLTVRSRCVPDRPPLPRWSGALLILAPAAYLAISAVDMAAQTSNPAAAIAPMDALSFSRVLPDLVTANAWWLNTGLLPHMLDAGPGERLRMTLVFFPTEPALALFAKTLYVTVVIGISVLVALLAFRRGRDPVEHRRALGIAGVAAALLLSSEALLAAGRFSAFGVIRYLTYNTHPGYMFWMFFLVVVYALARPGDRWRGALFATVFTAILLLALVNASFTRAMNAQVRTWGAARNGLVARLRSLVEIHGRERDFSFFVDPDHPGNDVCIFMRRPSDPPGRVYRVAEALYLPYFTAANPKYVLAKDGLWKPAASPR